MASNVVSTTGSTRADMGEATVLTGVLKDVYLAGMVNTIFFNDDFTRLIQAQTAKMDATGRRIIQAFDIGRSGGVGPMAEGGSFRDSVPIDANQGYEWLRYDNAYFELTGPAIATIKAGEGSYVDIVTKHMESMIKSAKMNVERILMGAGDGVVGWVSSDGSTHASELISVDGAAFYDTQFVENGMYINVHDGGSSAGNASSTFGTERTYDGTNADMTIASFTKGSKKTGDTSFGVITIDQDMDGNNTIVQHDPVTRKHAYTSTTCLEPNGLFNLISDGATTCHALYGAETTNTFKYVWPSASSNGIDRTTYDYVKSQIVNIAGELDEENLLETVIENQNQYQATPNLLAVTPRAQLKYFGNTKDDRRFNTMSAMNWVGGYTGLGIQLGSLQLMLAPLMSVPKGIAYLINTRDFAFMRPPGMSGYKWLTSEGGSVLRQKEGSDNMFASAVDYWNFVCKDPGRQCKMYNITE